MTDDPRDIWNAIIGQVSDEYEADIYLYSGAIDDSGFGKITKAVANNKNRDKAVLILVTNGGLANAAYQIARLFQTQYEDFTIFCPSRCKSAGTLIALGANRLIMDAFSELGPLDVQLVKQNEIFARKSGLLSRSSFDALSEAAFELYERLMVGITLKSGGNVSFKLASELSASMASTMMAPIYAQINPETVGSENRDLNIAFEYGSRLIVCSSNASVQSVFKLVYGYPSHDFIIDGDEARQLFTNVDYPSESLYQLVGFFGDAAYDEAEPSLVQALIPVPIEGVEEDDDFDAGTGRSEGPDDGSDGAGAPLDDGRVTDRPINPEAPSEDGAGCDAGEPSSDEQNKAKRSSTRVSPVRMLKGASN